VRETSPWKPIHAQGSREELRKQPRSRAARSAARQPPPLRGLRAKGGAPLQAPSSRRACHVAGERPGRWRPGRGGVVGRRPDILTLDVRPLLSAAAFARSGRSRAECPSGWWHRSARHPRRRGRVSLMQRLGGRLRLVTCRSHFASSRAAVRAPTSSLIRASPRFTKNAEFGSRDTTARSGANCRPQDARSGASCPADQRGSRAAARWPDSWGRGPPGEAPTGPC